jgi:hypothetical protein
MLSYHKVVFPWDLALTSCAQRPTYSFFLWIVTLLHDQTGRKSRVGDHLQFRFCISDITSLASSNCWPLLKFLLTSYRASALYFKVSSRRLCIRLCVPWNSICSVWRPRTFGAFHCFFVSSHHHLINFPTRSTKFFGQSIYVCKWYFWALLNN